MNLLSKDGDTMQKDTPILITGAGGFIGKNLVANLRTAGFTDLMLFEKDDTPETLAQYAARAGFVFHLAGINRPKDPSEFYAGNSGLTDVLLDLLAKVETPAPVLVTSSTQAALDNDYGKSKAMAEAAVYAYGEKTGAPVYVFRLPGVFGKWCRPNYNSVVATFCHNAAHGLPLEVRDPAYFLHRRHGRQCGHRRRNPRPLPGGAGACDHSGPSGPGHRRLCREPQDAGSAVSGGGQP